MEGFLAFVYIVGLVVMSIHTGNIGVGMIWPLYGLVMGFKQLWQDMRS